MKLELKLKLIFKLVLLVGGWVLKIKLMLSQLEAKLGNIFVLRGGIIIKKRENFGLFPK